MAYAQDGQAGFATVVRVQGLASYTLGDGNWHPLIAGKALVAGSTIRTGDGGIVDVVLGKQIDFPQSQRAPDRISPAADSPVRGLISSKPAEVQNVVRLTPGTVLTIDKLTTIDTGADTVSDTELNLQQGKIFASVKKLSATSQYLVKIPNGIAGVRGTEFSISADGATAVFESTTGGLVLSLTIGGVTTTYVVAAGQMLEPASGGTAPISPGLDGILSDVFTALKTTYNVVVSFDYNDNNIYISSITGIGANP
ncbi:MAG TPA: FecR domain-containing protein [Phycisphaerae bacterium]|nr:FecR domain-containing protein [Phycisphaerae bacterium]